MKKFLKKNKIYFEVFSSFFLGLMAITVSIVSVTVSIRQTKNEELLNQPSIKITSNHFGYETEKIDSELLIIENDGGKLTNFKAAVKSFIKIETYKESSAFDKEEKIIHLTLSDYFNVNSATNNFQGKIFQFTAFKTYNKLRDLEANFRVMNDYKFPLTLFSMEHYLELSYMNYRGETISKLFLISSSTGTGIELERTVRINDLLQKWDLSKSVSIYKLTSEDVIAIINSNNN